MQKIIALAEDFAGGCYLLDLDNREYYVATYGDLRYILTDDRIDTLVSNAGSYARNGDWEGTLSSMMSDTKTYINDGVQEGTALYDVETGTYTFYEPPKSMTSIKQYYFVVTDALGQECTSGIIY